MRTSVKKNKTENIAVSVRFTNSMICLFLVDGREINTPLEFYPRLAKAKKKQLENYRLIGGGLGIHWDDLDEDLSVESIILGRRANNY